jgi:hypothetical protein
MKKIGIDIGWTIKGERQEGDRNKPAPESFRIISRMVELGYDVYLISKVDSKQREEVEQWLTSTDFFNKTGVKPESLYFCFERKDKALFVKALGICAMIDDRPEVLAFLDDKVAKFLISPEPSELTKWKDRLVNTQIVSNWLEIEQSFF